MRITDNFEIKLPLWNPLTFAQIGVEYCNYSDTWIKGHSVSISFLFGEIVFDYTKYIKEEEE